MSQVLYRKYRPQKFSEIKGQEHVVQTLKGAIEMNRVAHAYLFCGPRGTGKTTIARIFAKALNCEDKKSFEPCNICATCTAINENRSMDIIEIDGASNRGIDEIRNIKEIARVSSSQNNYKIFIIDEVHSLTKDAFNALLKTLEEPPSHVKFILATTEPHRLLPTVLSRVQRFDFKKISNSNILEKLKEIAFKEKVKADEEVFRLVAANADGALRDAESNFAKLISLSGNNITIDSVKDVLGFIPFSYYINFLSGIFNKNKEEGLKIIAELYETGVDLEVFTKGFIDFCRKIIMAKINPKIFDNVMTQGQLDEILRFAGKIETKEIIIIINKFLEVRNQLKNTPIPQLPLEIAVIELSDN